MLMKMNKFRLINVTVAISTPFVLLLSACVHMPSRARVAPGPSLKLASAQGPVTIAFKPQLNNIDITDYHSQSVTKAFSNDQVVKTLTDSLDFTVQTKTVAIDKDNQTATYDLKTTKKTGIADLADFALPELGETLELMMTNQGKVLKAGDYPPGTLFFVPPVSLPDNPVKVGDSWPMTTEWVSLKSGIPLMMKTQSTLKAIRQCGASGPCAEIALSGLVNLEKPDQVNSTGSSPTPSFKSSLSGTLLFSLDRGTVLYSYLKSSESLAAKSTRITIDSCMVTRVSTPADENLTGAKPLQCDPADDLPRY